MTLLDKFRAPARDKHSDPLVRLAHLEDLPLDDREAIGAFAREDDDPRVRKAAVAKLMDPQLLAAIARDDRDDGVRAQATGMLRDIALEAFEEIGETESLAAVDQLSDSRGLAQVAKAAVRESVALRALARVDDVRLLGSIARHGVSDAARLQAAAILCRNGERAEMLAVALHSEFKDTAVLSVDALGDRADLEQIVNRGQNKSAVKRARTIIREADEQAAREAAETALARSILAQEAPAVESVSEDVTAPHGDPFAGIVDVDASAEPAALDAEDEAEAAERSRREAEAAESAREAEALERERRHAKLAAMLDETAEAAPDESFEEAQKRVNALRREWRGLTAGIEVDPALAARFDVIDQAMSARETEAREIDQRARREALSRVQQLLNRVEALPARADLTLKAAERALKDVRTAISALPPLPSRQDADDMQRRLKSAQSALTPKVQELREADEWRRFGNVTLQEQLCAQMEALDAVEDPEAIARDVRMLQEQWRAAAEVPRAQADALWRRFKAAHDKVWPRCEAHFAAQAQVRAENLARKVALCEQVEAVAESTDWIQTADAIKALQAEWKTIGPVSRGREKAIWDRFRAACDRFFTRRHDDLAARKTMWAENLAKKDALCARAEALAESTDWDQAAQELKNLQAEWKTIGAVKKSKSEAIWQRFRAASDRFFARHAMRHDTARAERVAAREAICTEVEALAVLDPAPDDLPGAMRAVRARWQQEIAGRGVDPQTARALDERFNLAVGSVVGRWPEAFAGTELDPAANEKRMEAIVRRMEELAASLSGPAATESLSPTDRLAAMLKEALAANTIGGKAEDDSRWRAAAEDVRQAQASWSRLGLVSDDTRRKLTDRFQRAVRAVTTKAGSSHQRVGASSFSTKSRK
jgi:hypothetical protein